MTSQKRRPLLYSLHLIPASLHLRAASRSVLLLWHLVGVTMCCIMFQLLQLFAHFTHILQRCPGKPFLHFLHLKEIFYLFSWGSIPVSSSAYSAATFAKVESLSVRCCHLLSVDLGFYFWASQIFFRRFGHAFHKRLSDFHKWKMIEPPPPGAYIPTYSHATPFFRAYFDAAFLYAGNLPILLKKCAPVQFSGFLESTSPCAFLYPYLALID